MRLFRGARKELPRRAFTLIELLVVMTIISILASMLLPVLGRARDTARTVNCLSNLKQLALWGQQYADDWSGTLPTSGTSQISAAWASSLYWRLSPTEWNEKCPAYKRGSTGGTVLHCPKANSVVKPRWTAGGRGDNEYALNRWLGGVLSDNSNVNLATPEHPRTRFLTSRKFWFADGVFLNSASGWYYYAESGCAPKVISWQTTWLWMWDETKPFFGQGHSGSQANFAFGDGHTRTMQRTDITSMTLEEEILWHGNAAQ